MTLVAVNEAVAETTMNNATIEYDAQDRFLTKFRTRVLRRKISVEFVGGEKAVSFKMEAILMITQFTEVFTELF